MLGHSYNIIIDCQHLEYINSSGLGILINMKKQLEEHNKQMYFLNLKGKPLQVIQTLGIDSAFEIINEEEKEKILRQSTDIKKEALNTDNKTSGNRLSFDKKNKEQVNNDDRTLQVIDRIMGFFNKYGKRKKVLIKEKYYNDFKKLVEGKSLNENYNKFYKDNIAIVDFLSNKKVRLTFKNRNDHLHDILPSEFNLEKQEELKVFFQNREKVKKEIEEEIEMLEKNVKNAEESQTTIFIKLKHYNKFKESNQYKQVCKKYGLSLNNIASVGSNNVGIFCFNIGGS
jgi:MFS superfamily sulfate permease-like transporter